MRRGNVDGLAMEEDLARVAVHRAEERHHHLRAPRADQTGKAQNFAAADMKADVLKKTCVRQPPDLQNRLSDRNVLLGEHVGDIAADHAGNEAALRNLGNRPLTDGLAVAHDADIVAELEDLLHAVRDIDDRAVFGGQAVDNLEEALDLARRQRGGGLVHDDDSGVGGQRLCNFQHLLLGDAERADLGCRVDIQVILVEKCLCPFDRVPDPDEAGRADPFVAQVHIGLYCHLRHQIQLLIDHCHTGSLRVLRLSNLHRLAVNQDFACVAGNNAGQYAHQRRFSGTVFAHQDVDLAAIGVVMDIGKRVNAAEALGNPFHFQCFYIHHCVPPHCV